MVHWRIGCSGFHYKHWKEVFYPHGLAQNKWFTFYCEHFNTLELNVTFYRFPQLDGLLKFYNGSPEQFMFSVKAPQAITHYKLFKDSERMLGDFYASIYEGLQEKLGCVLFQLPSRIPYSEDMLQRIIDVLDPSFDNVLEFRNEGWWNEKVYNQLQEHKISFCGMSHPLLPEKIVMNTDVAYYRMHGVPELYKSPYPKAALNKIVKKVEKKGPLKKAFIYFNNDIDASAIKNAKEMIELVVKE